MSGYSVSLLLTALASFALGLFVYLKGRERATNRLLAFLSLAMAFWCFGQLMGNLAEDAGTVLLWTKLGLAGAVLLPVFFCHFIFSLIERREEALLRTVYGLGGFFLLLLFTPLFVADIRPVFDYRFYPQAGPAYPWFALFTFSCFVYAFFRLFQAFRAAYGEKKIQLLYVVLACLIGYLGGITAFFPVWGIDFPVLSHFALPLYVAITIYAILKHQLLDLSVLTREGTIYLILTVFFSLFYAAIYFGFDYLFHSVVRVSPAAATVLVVFISVLVFQPLKDRVQKLVDHLFQIGEYRYRRTIAGLSAENRRLFLSLLRADKLASLGTLSAGMAHEIKNPLAALKGMTQVLPENLDDREWLAGYQEIVGRQIERINGIVEKLLKFGQPPAIDLKEVDLAAVIDEALALFEDKCRRQGIKIERRIGALPPVQGDRERLTQVIVNLALNAIEAMPKGGVLTVVAGSQYPVARVFIEIADTGIGMPAGELARIFDPFYTTKDTGTGMGLAVAYRSVQEHQGEIEADSEVGRGSRFRLWLPIKPERSV